MLLTKNLFLKMSQVQCILAITAAANPAGFSREVDLINSAKINVFLNGDHWKADNKSIFTLMSQVCLLEFDLKTYTMT